MDTVKEGKTGFQMGTMDPDELAPEDVAAVAETMGRACKAFGTPQHDQMVAACIGQDLSWCAHLRFTALYGSLYHSVAWRQLHALRRAEM